ncbi:MAG: ribokinase [Aigarchaeota archaeon]|nr:ribokinase [Candidatus Pelearchaeum maunauluense]
MSINIAVLGATHVDYTLVVERLPRVGETVIGGELKFSLGGKGANQAVAASRLGAETFFISRVGEDALGGVAIEGLRKNNVHTEYVYADPDHPTGIALIFVDREGRNMIGVAPGVDEHITPNDVDNAREALSRAAVFLTQLEIPVATVEYAVREVKRMGKTVILNPAPAKPLPESLLSCVDILTPNEVELAMLTNEQPKTQNGVISAARKLIDNGVGAVVVTLGAEGALLVTEEAELHIRGVRVSAVDTTGAGDAFNAAMAVMLARGRELDEAVRYANYAGALATTKLGAQEALPTIEELERFLAKR